MKTILLISIIIICTYIGKLLSEKISYKLSFFNDLRITLSLINTKLKNGNSLNDSILSIDIKNEAVKKLFERFLLGINNDPSRKTEDIWIDALDNIKICNTMNLNNREKMLLCDTWCGIEFDCLYNKNFLEIMKRYSDYIDDFKDEVNKRKKLYTNMSVLTGIAICIVLI